MLVTPKVVSLERPRRDLSIDVRFDRAGSCFSREKIEFEKDSSLGMIIYPVNYGSYDS